MDHHHHDRLDHLFHAILSLNTIDECYEFFEDACTIKELQDLSQRFEVATLLWQGKNYQEVNQLTGASTATICRVKKCLVYGNSGYRLALDRMSQQEEQT